jgi:hypothetical protein
MGALLRACARHGNRDRAPSSGNTCSSSGTTRTRRFAKRRLSLLSSQILLAVRF